MFVVVKTAGWVKMRTYLEKIVVVASFGHGERFITVVSNTSLCTGTGWPVMY